MINITGVSDSRIAPVAAYRASEDRQTLIIVPTFVRAQRLAADLSFFSKDKEIFVLPEEEQVFLKYNAKNQDRLIERMKALKALRTGKPVIVIAPVSAAVKKISPHDIFEENVIKLSMGLEIEPSELKEHLTAMGYEYAHMVEGHGQFSIRGGIIDIFTPDSDHPYRVELFGNEVDSLRSFNIDSQRSIENLKYIEIYPAQQIAANEKTFKRAAGLIKKEYGKQAEKLRETAPEASEKLRETAAQICEYIDNVSNMQLLENYIHYFYEKTEYIWDYMQSQSVMIDDPERIFEILDMREQELKNDFEVLLERGEAVPKDAKLIGGIYDLKEVLAMKQTVIFTPFPKRIRGIETFDKIYNVLSRQVINFGGNMNLLESELKAYDRKGYKITIVSNSVERLEKL